MFKGFFLYASTVDPLLYASTLFRDSSFLQQNTRL